MDILNTLAFKSIRQVKTNFDGDDLPSDAGLMYLDNPEWINRIS